MAEGDNGEQSGQAEDAAEQQEHDGGTGRQHVPRSFAILFGLECGDSFAAFVFVVRRVLIVVLLLGCHDRLPSCVPRFRRLLAGFRRDTTGRAPICNASGTR